MKNRKNIIILLLIVFWVVVIVGGFLFYTNTLGVDNSNHDISENNTSSDNENETITKNEAINVLKNKFSFAQSFFSASQPYCGEGAVLDNEMQSDGVSYYRSTKFTNVNELNDYLEQYISSDVIGGIVPDYYVNQSDNYIQYGDSLYCVKRNESISNKYMEENSDFKIVSLDSNIITAVVTTNYKEVVNITLNKYYDNWQITKYEVKK